MPARVLTSAEGLDVGSGADEENSTDDDGGGAGELKDVVLGEGAAGVLEVEILDKVDELAGNLFYFYATRGHFWRVFVEAEEDEVSDGVALAVEPGGEGVEGGDEGEEDGEEGGEEGELVLVGHHAHAGPAGARLGNGPMWVLGGSPVGGRVEQ